MGRRRKGAVPELKRHKASGLAFVWVNGKADYLGGVRWGTDEATAAYRDFLARWTAANPTSPYRAPRAACAVAQLAKEYLDSLIAQHGEANQQVRETRRALVPLLAVKGASLADSVTHDDLESVQSGFVAAGLTRGVINARIGRIRRMFRYGVRRSLVDAATVVRLESLPDIGLGHPGTPEDHPVRPVDEKVVKATLPFLTRQCQAMVQLQMVIGCRPGEICRMKGEEIDKAGIVRLSCHEVKLPGVWVWQPERHKTKRRGKILAYILGPKAQKLLRRWLRPGYLFSAQEACQEKYARSRKGHREYSRDASARITTGRAPHDHYRPASYGAAIAVAAKKAGQPHWHPHQLRHLVASRLDRLAGIEASRTMLGHSSIGTTELYIARDYKVAAKLAKRHG